MKETINRRDFLKTAGSAALFAAMGIQVSSCNVSSNNQTDLPEGIEITGKIVRIDTSVDRFKPLKEDGGWENIQEIDLIVVNINGQLIRSFNNACPHESCKDSWIYLNNRLRCTCHDSIFENNGTRISGPAQRNLTEYSTTRDGDFIVIDRS